SIHRRYFGALSPPPRVARRPPGDPRPPAPRCFAHSPTAGRSIRQPGAVRRLRLVPPRARLAPRRALPEPQTARLRLAPRRSPSSRGPAWRPAPLREQGPAAIPPPRRAPRLIATATPIAHLADQRRPCAHAPGLRRRHRVQ